MENAFTRLVKFFFQCPSSPVLSHAGGKMNSHRFKENEDAVETKQSWTYFKIFARKSYF